MAKHISLTLSQLGRTAEMPETVQAYGCVRCQKHHTERSPVFDEHIYFQSKHGIRRISKDDADRYDESDPTITSTKERNSG